MGSRSSRKNSSSTARGSEWKGKSRSCRQILKTHKSPGQVERRAIHSATKNPLDPLGKYVACKLRKVLSRERNILNSLEEFHARTEELQLDQDDRLITADVRDFLVVGDHWYLARMTASILEPMDRNLIERGSLCFHSETHSWPAR